MGSKSFSTEMPPRNMDVKRSNPQRNWNSTQDCDEEFNDRDPDYKPGSSGRKRPSARGGSKAPKKAKPLVVEDVGFKGLPRSRIAIPGPSTSVTEGRIQSFSRPSTPPTPGRIRSTSPPRTPVAQSRMQSPSPPRTPRTPGRSLSPSRLDELRPLTPGRSLSPSRLDELDLDDFMLTSRMSPSDALGDSSDRASSSMNALRPAGISAALPNVLSSSGIRAPLPTALGPASIRAPLPTALGPASIRAPVPTALGPASIRAPVPTALGPASIRAPLAPLQMNVTGAASDRASSSSDRASSSMNALGASSDQASSSMTVPRLLGYRANSPIIVSVSPPYIPTSPTYSPHSPNYRHSHSGHQPTSPYIPTSPTYIPTSPTYSPHAPNYRPSHSGHQPTSPPRPASPVLNGDMRSFFNASTDIVGMMLTVNNEENEKKLADTIVELRARTQVKIYTLHT